MDTLSLVVGLGLIIWLFRRTQLAKEQNEDMAARVALLEDELHHLKQTLRSTRAETT